MTRGSGRSRRPAPESVGCARRASDHWGAAARLLRPRPSTQCPGAPRGRWVRGPAPSGTPRRRPAATAAGGECCRPCPPSSRRLGPPPRRRPASGSRTHGAEQSFSRTEQSPQSVRTRPASSNTRGNDRYLKQRDRQRQRVPPLVRLCGRSSRQGAIAPARRQQQSGVADIAERGHLGQLDYLHGADRVLTRRPSEEAMQTRRECARQTAARPICCRPRVGPAKAPSRARSLPCGLAERDKGDGQAAHASSASSPLWTAAGLCSTPTAGSDHRPLPTRRCSRPRSRTGRRRWRRGDAARKSPCRGTEQTPSDRPSEKEICRSERRRKQHVGEIRANKKKKKTAPSHPRPTSYRPSSRPIPRSAVARTPAEQAASL